MAGEGRTIHTNTDAQADPAAIDAEETVAPVRSRAV